MANEFVRGSFNVGISLYADGPTDASHTPNQQHFSDYTNAGAFYITKMLDMTAHDLTVASGNLDIDLYDLGTLDIGAGPGRDNLGQTWAQSKVHSFYLSNLSASAGTLRVDQAGLGSTAWSSVLGSNAVVDLSPGSCLAFDLGEAGVDIADVTNHVVRLSAQTDDVMLNLNITVS